jgi:GTPase SAR1 family protein
VLQLAEQYNISFMEVSARENVNVDESFVLLAKQIKDKNIEQVENSPTLNEDEEQNKQQKIPENLKQKSIKLNELNTNKKSDSKCCS